MNNLRLSDQDGVAGRTDRISTLGGPVGPAAKLGTTDERRGDSYLRVLVQVNGGFSKAHDDTASITVDGWELLAAQGSLNTNAT
jgi:hypothetical protein